MMRVWPKNNMSYNALGKHQVDIARVTCIVDWKSYMGTQYHCEISKSVTTFTPLCENTSQV